MMGDRNRVTENAKKINKGRAGWREHKEREREKENQKGDEDLPLNGQHRSFWGCVQFLSCRSYMLDLLVTPGDLATSVSKPVAWQPEDAPNLVLGWRQAQKSTRKKVKSLSHVWLFETPWTVACQAPPSKGFSRQEYWSGLPFPSPGDLPNPGIKPRSPSLKAASLLSDPPGRPMELFKWGRGSVITSFSASNLFCYYCWRINMERKEKSL